MPNYPLPRQCWLIPGCLLLALLMAACGDSATTGSTPRPVQATPTAAQPTPTSAPVHNKAGQLVKVGSWEVTVNSVKSSQGGNGVTTDADKQFILVNVTLHNVGSANANVSSVTNFQLKQSDGTLGQNASFIGTSIGGSPAPDGMVMPGDKLRGDLVFTVLKTEKAFAFTFAPDFGGSDMAVWDLSL